MSARLLLGLACLCICSGCARHAKTMTAVFPAGSQAAPWVLQDAVWDGSFVRAARALGDDAEDWRLFRPTRVWLAVYHHEDDPKRRTTVRAFAFDSRVAARNAYEHFRPTEAKAFNAGDEGCWTEIGVLFVWGRMVFDVFGNDASFSSQGQSAYVTALIEKEMPTTLPEAPR
ncbi:MAG TPA: hypothetical protein VM487_04940 [Phycisphaerae bacterium]|nr:hypothetical protein [Phycisphaerae bacterium]